MSSTDRDGELTLIHLTITLRRWDITRFRPYYLKSGDQNVVHGVLDADATVRIAGKT